MTAMHTTHRILGYLADVEATFVGTESGGEDEIPTLVFKARDEEIRLRVLVDDPIAFAVISPCTKEGVPLMGIPERLGGRPRENRDDAFATCMDMSDGELRGLIGSLAGGGVLTPPEQEGLERALKYRKPFNTE